MLTISTRLFDPTSKLLLLSQRECITKLNEHLSLGQEPLPHVTMLGIGLPSVLCFHDLGESPRQSTCEMLQIRNRLKQPV